MIIAFDIDIHLCTKGLILILKPPFHDYLTSILSTSSLASFQVSTFFFAQSMWHLAYAIFKLRLASFLSNPGGGKYHITPEILLFFQLESFEILQNTCACVLDILLRYIESSFKLRNC